MGIVKANGRGPNLDAIAFRWYLDKHLNKGNSVKAEKMWTKCILLTTISSKNI